MPELNLHNNQRPGPVPYTFRIGVTGHRNLKDPEAVEQVIESVLESLNSVMLDAVIDPYKPHKVTLSPWRRYENIVLCVAKRLLSLTGILKRETPPEDRTPFNWIIVSSLARGADSMVASGSIKVLEASLQAILPFRPEDYRQDFTEPQDLQHFNFLYEKAASKLNYDFENKPAPENRPDGYRKAGESVVQSAEIIIAVWDGKPTHGAGGTAEIVEYALSLKRPVIWINANNEEYPVCLLESIARNEEGKDYTVKVKSFPGNVAELSPQFLQVSEYNRDKAFDIAGYREIYERSYSRIKKAAEASGIPDVSIDKTLTEVSSHYARADHLARQYQKIHARSAQWLYRLSTIAVTVAVVQALFVPDQTGWISLEILALLTALLWYRLGINESWQEKWLDYRHLAERLRIMTFSGLLKKDSEFIKQGRVQSLPFYQGPGEWVLKVCDHVQGILPVPGEFGNKFDSVKNFILAGLIRDQAEYYGVTARKKARLNKTENQFIGVLLIVILLAAVMHLFKLVHSAVLENIIVALVVVLPAIAASQHAIGSIRDYERISSRSLRMQEILWRLEKSIEKTTTFEELIREIHNTEDILSTENQEWCVSLSFRRISLPV